MSLHFKNEAAYQAWLTKARACGADPSEPTPAYLQHRAVQERGVPHTQQERLYQRLNMLLLIAIIWVTVRYVIPGIFLLVIVASITIMVWQALVTGTMFS